jgi:O-antigen biosynthesis protein
LFIWRARPSEALAQAISLVKVNKGVIIYDLDDLMIEPALAHSKYIDGIRSQNLDRREVAAHFQGMLDVFLQADVGIAPTASLAHRMRAHGKAVLVIPNGYDEGTLALSREAVRRRRMAKDDGLIRVGYAAGTRTSQRDFG